MKNETVAQLDSIEALAYARAFRDVCHDEGSHYVDTRTLLDTIDRLAAQVAAK